MDEFLRPESLVSPGWNLYISGPRPYAAVHLRSCGTRFSSQTFSLDYGVKKKLSYQEIFHHITSSGSGIRALARLLGVTDKVITHRIGRLAIRHRSSCLTPRETPLQEDLTADGFESFTQSQYYPNNIHLLVGKSHNIAMVPIMPTSKEKAG